MTKEEAARVKVGDRVVFHDWMGGKVVEVGYCAFKVLWDDEVYSIFPHDQADGIKLATD